MDIKNVPFRFVDVGGQRTQRQKWHQCFSDVTAILFLASSSEFDEYLREDAQTNRLEESLKVFETLINYKYLKNVEFILFLNKHDLLVEKLKARVNIKDYFADFVGDPFCISDVENFLIKKFVSLKKPTFESDTQRSSQLENDYDMNHQTNKLIKRDVDNLDLIANLKSKAIEHNNHANDYNKLNSSDANVNQKSIYTHFTTAIDTNNIRTIFEMVRLMIFEKNCKAIMLS
jgi:guanine nucleotide-binding protein subunit alpha-13